ncbi:hypothetical protein PV328_006727 [Microctonus aethiopoides]|uniref:Neurotransmitter-gated ion-channel transmembrane domain-containing protein n=1 Tax=Microctonus aethiopoides TaxID=144406 RepID=A0AA39FPQ3_9HYME|nr:hypothetical protein PV328_006727 [Microctonus aethiopoides]
MGGSEADDYGRKEVSLSLKDILPLNPKAYDKHRAPKYFGQPTVVYFHVTVLSLDSINEESMIVFNLRRRLGYHLFHTYIPSALIVVMSWIAFWIKPEAIPARVTLGVTSLLTLATQNTQSQQSLPPVSYVKAIDVWMSSCSVFVFLSLMEFAIVNNYMGPVATKAMKGYSDEDLRESIDEFKTPMRPESRNRSPTRPLTVQYDTCCSVVVNSNSCSSCNNNSLKFGSISEKSPKSDDVEFDDADDVEHIDKTLDSINVDRVGRM